MALNINGKVKVETPNFSEKEDGSNNSENNENYEVDLKNYTYLAINFGKVDSDMDDLWDCLFPPALNILIDEDEYYYVQISEEAAPFKKFNEIEQVFSFYADILLKNKAFDTSKEYLVGMMQSAFDEDEDGMYHILKQEGGEIKFIYSENFDSSWDSALFCMIQSAELEAAIDDNGFVYYDDEKVPLNDIFGYIDDFDIRGCVYI